MADVSKAIRLAVDTGKVKFGSRDAVKAALNGEAKLMWTPETAGEYKIEATSRDREGHAIRSAAWV